MRSLKFVAVLAIVCFARADGYDWLPCLKRALAAGIPALGLPGHDPLIYSKEYTMFELVGFTVEAGYDLNWTNIPWWDLTSTIEVENDVYWTTSYNLWWDNWTINTLLDADILTPLGEKIVLENVIVNATFTGVTWTGTANITKPTSTAITNVNLLTLNWTNSDVSVKWDGDDVSGAAVDLLKVVSDLNLASSFLLEQINDNWLSNSTLMNGVKDWCANN